MTGPLHEFVAGWDAEGLGWVDGMEHTNWPDAWAGLRALAAETQARTDAMQERLDAALALLKAEFHRYESRDCGEVYNAEGVDHLLADLRRALTGEAP